MLPRRVAGFTAAATLWLFSVAPHAQVSDQDLNAERDRLLMSYAKFKVYPSANPDDLYKQLMKQPDRQAVFDAILRALFVQLEDSQGELTKLRLITFVDELRSIWGVRKTDREGRRQFRVSVTWRPAVLEALNAAGNMAGSDDTGHVLLPVVVGGDDDPQFKGFDLRRGSAAFSYRQKGELPRLQLSFLSANSRIGEVDLDFDKGICSPLDCHCKPSNSDVGSYKSLSDDHHPAMFNERVKPYVPGTLKPRWDGGYAHCKDSY